MGFGFKSEKLVILLIFTQEVVRCSAENNVNITSDLLNGKLSDYSPEICNKNGACPCHPELKNQNSDHIPFAEENEKCAKQEDCCGILLCIHGICRKPTPNIELVTLVKVCLGITVTAIIVGIFGALVKYLIRYDRLRAFRRSSDSWSLNSTFTHVLSTPQPLYEIQEEKPPSYEECVGSTEIKQPTEQDPPVINSNNTIIPPTNNQPQN